MKKAVYAILISVFALVVLSSTVTSCISKTFDMLQTKDGISEISLIELTFSNESELIQTELQSVENIDDFLTDFNKIECAQWFGDPCGVTEKGKDAFVIKILYENGEYELINWNGQATYTLDRGLNYYDGYSIFNEDQFFSLIEKYFPDYAETSADGSTT